MAIASSTACALGELRMYNTKKSEKWREISKSMVGALDLFSVTCVSQLASMEPERIDKPQYLAICCFGVAIPILSFAFVSIRKWADDLDSRLAIFAVIGMTFSIIGIFALFLHFGWWAFIAFASGAAAVYFALWRLEKDAPEVPAPAGEQSSGTTLQ